MTPPHPCPSARFNGLPSRISSQPAAPGLSNCRSGAGSSPSNHNAGTQPRGRGCLPRLHPRNVETSRIDESKLTRSRIISNYSPCVFNRLSRNPIDARDRLAIIKMEQAAMNHFQYRGKQASDPWAKMGAKMGARKGDGQPFSIVRTHSKTAFHRKKIAWLSSFLAASHFHHGLLGPPDTQKTRKPLRSSQILSLENLTSHK